MTPDYTFMLEKARQYCDYQERCIYDVKQKMKLWQARPEVIEQVILQLEKENFIDEDRYIRAFALGKMRNNKWGRNKIIYALRMKNIPDLMIQIGIQEIDNEEYPLILRTILEAKKISEKDPYKKKAKLAQYAIQKGFQPALVWQILNETD